jgi:hypothetical protein
MLLIIQGDGKIMTKGKLPWEEKVLDGKHCNQLWLELKTLKRVQAKLTDEGIVSPRTGKEISRPAIAMSVWRWSCRNPEESFEIESKSRAASGSLLTRDLWNIELINHARQIFSPHGYSKWLKEKGLEQLAQKFALS